MKFGNLSGRAVLLGNGGAMDIESASGGALPSDPMEAIDRWDDVRAFSDTMTDPQWLPYDADDLLAPVPMPRQSFGIALNYRAHAVEAGWDIPEIPLIFSKMPGCLSAPNAEILLPTGTTDWEVELVVVIGRKIERVTESAAVDAIAGLAVGQDISERTVQRTRPGPQHTLAKSYRTFGPWGPAITTLDELESPFALDITCHINGEEMQNSNTSDLIFGVPELISFLSLAMPLYPGDVIFTGTPSGVGSARRPPVYLKPGDVLVSSIEGLGELRNECRSDPLR